MNCLRRGEMMTKSERERGESKEDAVQRSETLAAEDKLNKSIRIGGCHGLYILVAASLHWGKSGKRSQVKLNRAGNFSFLRTLQFRGMKFSFAYCRVFRTRQKNDVLSRMETFSVSDMSSFG